jgi:phage terminase large subunit GpA-like protein
VQRVVMMFSAQSGKTEAGSNFLGYVIDHAPGPRFCVQPIPAVPRAQIDGNRMQNPTNMLAPWPHR